MYSICLPATLQKGKIPKKLKNGKTFQRKPTAFRLIFNALFGGSELPQLRTNQWIMARGL